MLIEGYLSRRAMSNGEARVQFANRMRSSKPRDAAIPAATREHLQWAHSTAVARFETREFNQFDGCIENSSALTAVESRFRPERILSPTSLENYVACPFRFLLQHVLGFDELDEPDEEVEQTRRGSAYHRALARLHRRLKDTAELTKSPLPEQIGEQLAEEIDIAVQEYAVRAGSLAAKKLWELEGKRLHRSAAKYRGHWEDFVSPWRKDSAHLSPELLEADFGLATKHVQSIAVEEMALPLVIQVDGVEVRIGGRIDRVDLVELSEGLGFWIIDYKTGRASNYPATELARFEKLQLPLYAMAVERVIMSNRRARPLGLAYWLVTGDGPKVVTPGSRSTQAWLADAKKWTQFRGQLEAWIARIAEQIRQGRFPLAPRSERCTETCNYAQICRISQSRHVGKTGQLELPTIKEETTTDKVSRR
jgi:ATP-dependent helicase/DNAse subunit B